MPSHAEGAGADAVLAVSPFYWKVGEETLFNHFAAVAGSVNVPVMLYNLPMLTGIDLSPSLVARVAEECARMRRCAGQVSSNPSARSSSWPEGSSVLTGRKVAGEVRTRRGEMVEAEDEVIIRWRSVLGAEVGGGAS